LALPFACHESRYPRWSKDADDEILVLKIKKTARI
jgi:hypothetical protein